jgi:hypothetical protein
VLFKFAANEKVVLHQHIIHNKTSVVQGEHRLDEPDGSTLKEIRPTGMYKSSSPEILTMNRTSSLRSVTLTSLVHIKRNKKSPNRPVLQ